MTTTETTDGETLIQQHYARLTVSELLDEVRFLKRALVTMRALGQDTYLTSQRLDWASTLLDSKFR